MALQPGMAWAVGKCRFDRSHAVDGGNRDRNRESSRIEMVDHGFLEMDVGMSLEADLEHQRGVFGRLQAIVEILARQSLQLPGEVPVRPEQCFGMSAVYLGHGVHVGGSHGPGRIMGPEPHSTHTLPASR